MRARVLCAVLCAVLCGLTLSGCASKQKRYRGEFSGPFDTVTVVVGFAESEKAFNKYAEAFYERMKELHEMYDIYNEYEGLNNLCTVNKNAGIAPVAVGGDIIGLLEFGKDGYGMTGGVVNIAMGAVLRIWHDLRVSGISVLPTIEELTAANELTDINDLVIDRENGTVFLRKTGMSVDVGAIAKAYAESLAVKAAESVGMRSALISAGGDVVTVNKPDDDRDFWNVGIQDPDGDLGEAGLIDTLYLADNTVSCSGGYIRFFTVGGKTYNHIISPYTLMPADLYKNVTVLHKDAEMGDLLSTALFILPVDEGRELAARFGAEVLWIHNDGTWDTTEGYRGVSKAFGAVNGSN